MVRQLSFLSSSSSPPLSGAMPLALALSILPPLALYALCFAPLHHDGTPLLPLSSSRRTAPIRLPHPPTPTPRHRQHTPATATALRTFLYLAALATWLFLVRSALAPSGSEPWHVSPYAHARAPPDFRAWREAERALPQNDRALPPPQGVHGRYLHFANRSRKMSWARAMLEMVLDAHIAFESGRIFVMYGSDADAEVVPGDYDVFSSGLVHARVPISALLAGPIAGGSFPPSFDPLHSPADASSQLHHQLDSDAPSSHPHPHPPAVTADFFAAACPRPTRIDVDITLSMLVDDPASASAGTLLSHLAKHLGAMDDNCVELVADSRQSVFDYDELFADGARMADVWPALLSSPILTGWRWSPLVSAGVVANLRTILPGLPLPELEAVIPAPFDSPSSADAAFNHTPTPLRGLLALHIPRDTELADYCAEWPAPAPAAFNAYLASNILTNNTDGTESAAWGDFDPARCFPSLMRIVRRVAYVRRTSTIARGTRLERVYVLTNASRGWLAGLTYALRTAGGWRGVTSARDLALSWEQTFVRAGVDMMLAARAEVFVGNAWSTLTADVNMLRAAHGYAPETSQFW